MDITKFELSRKKDELTNSELEYFNSLSESEIIECIKHCNKKYQYFNAMQNAMKLCLNSVYGAFGNEFFVCSTTDIAGGVTAMGRDVIKYMDNINENYWYNYWHEDYELHKYLGITKTVEKLDPSWLSRLLLSDPFVPHDGEINIDEIQLKMEEGFYQRKEAVSAYADTDSLMVCFEKIIDDYCEVGHEQEFIDKIAKFRLQPLFKTKLNGYAKKYHVENLHDFELENINESIIFLAKKCYIKHTIWEDGTQYPRLQNIVPKGVMLIKKGTPKFAREKVMEIIKYLFDNSKTYNIKDLLKFVRDLKKEFELTDITDIVQSTNLNNYWSSKIIVDGQLIDGPGVVQDKEKLICAKGTYYVLKSAGLYNNLLYKHPELINTYQILKPGTKVKIYPCIHEDNNKFCYPMGKFPKEFAPPIDYDQLFSSTILDQVNVYVKSLNLPELNKRLRIVVSLF